MQRNSKACLRSPILETRARDCSGELNTGGKHRTKFRAKTSEASERQEVIMLFMKNPGDLILVFQDKLLLEHSICQVFFVVKKVKA